MLGAFNAARAGAGWPRNVSLVWFGTSLALLVCEAGFTVYDRLDPREKVETTGSYTESGYYTRDPQLGYGARPGAVVRSRRFTSKRPIYDVVYTIGGDGLRSTQGEPRGDTWLFMGCSRTFGEGVNDDETLPSRFSAELGYQANVVNMGFHGYGPHQMLRILETRALPDEAGPVRHVIYQAILHHVRRSAGRSSWDFEGPRYRLSGDSISLTGPFHSPGTAALMRLLRRSELARYFLDRLYYEAAPTSDEVELFGRIVERSAGLARERFGADFTVIFWDEDHSRSRQVLDRLVQTGERVIPASRIIPREEWHKLRFPVDNHPTPESYRRLAIGLKAHFDTVGPGARTKPDTALYLEGAQSRIQSSGPISASR